MTEYKGRGAWSSIGGTLTTSGKTTVPGPYYMLTKGHPWTMVGAEAFLNRLAGKEVDLNANAVWHGVLGIQLVCSGLLNDPAVPHHGLFNPETHDAVVRTQRLLQIADDGQVGKVTMKAMLIPIIKATAKQTGCPWEVAVGILQNEGGWDPGAVGRVDPEDWGLAQISHKAHPTLAFSDAYCPSYAVRFVCGTIGKRLRTFDGNIRDAIASYNLGEGGARTWIKAGRPDEWTTGAIHMNKYIDRILNAV